MSLNIQKKGTYDVIVVGGGTAGVFAAICAAKCCAKVLLVEKNTVLGGTMAVAGVNFPGLFYAWGKQIIDGPCFEAIKRTVQLGGAVIPPIQYKPTYHYEEQIRVNPFLYSTVLYEMCREVGVEILTCSMLSHIEETDDGIHAVLTDKSGMLAVTAKRAIDTTGDANAVCMAGYAVQKSEMLQPATLINRIGGYQMQHVDMAQLENVFHNDVFPDYLSFDMLVHYLKIGQLELHIPCTNAETSAGKTQLEMTARLTLLNIYRALRTVKGLEQLTVDFAAQETGVRETCRIVGENTVTAADYVNGVCYDDAVCYAFYPIDLHVLTGIKQQFLAEDVIPTIPYGALIPKGSPYMLCAGRCLSSDTDANSAIRVQAVCMATAQAAGCAAALSAQLKVPHIAVPYEKLTAALVSMGAIVPQHS